MVSKDKDGKLNVGFEFTRILLLTETLQAYNKWKKLIFPAFNEKESKAAIKADNQALKTVQGLSSYFKEMGMGWYDRSRVQFITDK